jgi:hypothetical protein
MSAEREALPMCDCDDAWHQYNTDDHKPTCEAVKAYNALRARYAVQAAEAAEFEARACALDAELKACRELRRIESETVRAQLAAVEQRAAIAEADRDECDRERRAVLADEAKLQHESMTMMQERDDARREARRAIEAAWREGYEDGTCDGESRYGTPADRLWPQTDAYKAVCALDDARGEAQG